MGGLRLTSTPLQDHTFLLAQIVLYVVDLVDGLVDCL